MSAINIYKFNYGMGIKISAYALNSVMSNQIVTTIHMKNLSKKMQTMLKNQFKRGYKIKNTHGQLNTLTDMLCDKYNLNPLPIFDQKFLGFHFMNNDVHFEKFLRGLALLTNLKVKKPNMYSCYRTRIDLVTSSSDQDFSPKELQKNILEYLNSNPEKIWNTQEQRQKVIEFIDSKRQLKITQNFN